MIYHKILFAFLAMAVFLIAPSVNSAEIEGVNFKESVTVDGTKLTVRGAGLLRYMGFIKAYVGALYVEEGVPTDAVLEDTAKRLEIEYFHAIKGEDFGPATDKVIVKNTEMETIERLRPKIDYHNSLYRDVQPGDRYSLTYVPGKGTELALNGTPIGTIEGADFASAIYAMWLGEKPMNKSFRKQLMGS